jgi:hypothetical protein
MARRLVCVVEGKGEALALPNLCSRVPSRASAQIGSARNGRQEPIACFVIGGLRAYPVTPSRQRAVPRRVGSLGERSRAVGGPPADRRA